LKYFEFLLVTFYIFLSDLQLIPALFFKCLANTVTAVEENRNVVLACPPKFKEKKVGFLNISIPSFVKFIYLPRLDGLELMENLCR
jgi:hypothetical protein